MHGSELIPSQEDLGFYFDNYPKILLRCMIVNGRVSKKERLIQTKVDTEWEDQARQCKQGIPNKESGYREL